MATVEGTQAGAGAPTEFVRWGDGGRGSGNVNKATGQVRAGRRGRTGAVLECGATGGVRWQHVQIAAAARRGDVEGNFACTSANDVARALIVASFVSGTAPCTHARRLARRPAFFCRASFFLLNEIGIFFLTVSNFFILTNFLNLIKYALFLT